MLGFVTSKGTPFFATFPLTKRGDGRECGDMKITKVTKSAAVIRSRNGAISLERYHPINRAPDEIGSITRDGHGKPWVFRPERTIIPPLAKGDLVSILNLMES